MSVHVAREESLVLPRGTRGITAATLTVYKHTVIPLLLFLLSCLKEESSSSVQIHPQVRPCLFLKLPIVQSRSLAGCGSRDHKAENLKERSGSASAR